MLAALPVLAAWREGPVIDSVEQNSGFLRYVFLVPTATAAVLVFGAVETGGLALFPVYGNRIGGYVADRGKILVR